MLFNPAYAFLVRIPFCKGNYSFYGGIEFLSAAAKDIRIRIYRTRYLLRLFAQFGIKLLIKSVIKAKIKKTAVKINIMPKTTIYKTLILNLMELIFIILFFQDISCAAEGMEKLLLKAPFNLAAQIINININDVGKAVKVLIPDML